MQDSRVIVAAGDGVLSWQTAQVQILPSVRSCIARNHNKEKDPGFIPAAEPTHTPAIDLFAQLDRLGQAKEFSLKLHQLTPVHIHASGRAGQSTTKASMAASTTGPDSEVSSTVMANNVLSFPAGPDPGAARSNIAGTLSRAMFQIGARRFVLEFRTSVTELHPVDTQVIPIATRKLKQKARRGPGSPLPGTPTSN